MDLNPQPPADWTSAEGPYELAEHCVKNNTDILILLNSWLDSGIPDDGDRIAEEDGEEVGEREETTGSDWHTLNYWAARLWPLWRKDAQRRVGVASAGVDGGGDVDGNEQGEEKSAHETIVVACNRTGEENGKSPYLPQTHCTDLDVVSQARFLQVPQQCSRCALDPAAHGSCIRWADARKVCRFGN